MNNHIILPVKKLGRIALVFGLSGLLLLALGLLLQPAGSARAWSMTQPAVKAAPMAALRYVAVEGTDVGNDCSLSTNPCATIQRAVDVAAPDDEIRVAAGTYTGVQVRQGITQVVYITQLVTIRGGYTTTNWSAPDPETYATTLDAQGQGRVVVVFGAPVTLEGLRITGGDTQSFADQSWPRLTGRAGGGLYIDASFATISGCQIYSNAATYFGGGLYAYSSAITVTQNRVFSNSLSPAYSIGGGIYVDLGIAVVDNNMVYGNRAVYGGGVYLGFGSLGGRLSENQIYNNRAYQRGGGLLLISTQTPDVLINRNVFSQNVAGTDGGGMWLGTGISVVTGNLVISNAASGFGGGTYLLNGSDILINNQFVSNTANFGGGMNLSASSATLSGNRFQSNRASLGGGVYAEGGSSGFTATANVLLGNVAAFGGGLLFYQIQGSVILTSNAFLQNNASNNGGAIFGFETDQLILERNIIFGNFGSFYTGVSLGIVTDTQVTNNAFLNNAGYALVLDRGHVTVAHNTVISNLGGISLLNYGVGPELTLSNTIFAGNTVALEAASGTTSTLNGVMWFGNGANTSGAGYITIGHQITANPLLAADSYHLLTGSPAIDTGVFSGITDDIDGEQRPSGSAVDIGADEWQNPDAAALRYVAVEGTDAGNDCSLSTNPCVTVQRAVDVAAPDDEIRVAAGTYTGVQVRQDITQVVYISQAVTIRGGYTTTNWTISDPETYATILDAQGEGRVAVITGMHATLENLRITGGDVRPFIYQSGDLVRSGAGGGLYIASFGATISGCQIYSNAATSNGGGLISMWSNITVTHNHIYSNHTSLSSSMGGGIDIVGNMMVVDNNQVHDNSAGFGGGLSLTFNSQSGRFSRNRVYNNRSVQGGAGISLRTVSGAEVLMAANVFSQNVAGADGGGAMVGGGVLVTGNLFINNTAAGKGGGAYWFCDSGKLLQNTFISNTSSSGGGAAVAGDVTLNENRFERNHADVGGGIEASNFGILTMTANVLVSNTATIGGGLAYDDRQGDVTLVGNTFVENNASYMGGGILANYGREAVLSRNVISGNVSPWGGGVALEIISGTLINNVLMNNTSYALMVATGQVTVAHNTIISNEEGIRLYNFGEASQLALIDTILAQNGTALEADAGTTTTVNGILWFGNGINITGSGSISIGYQLTADPLLAADGYHLLTGSPAIDTGVFSGITDDIDGELRPSGPAVDIGADEWLYPTSVELSVTQQVLPVVACPNQNVTYTIAYRNVGGMATGGIISAEIPTGLTNLNVINSGAVLTQVPEVTYTWQVADLSFGAGGLITITAIIMPGLAPQALTSTVSITASQSDSNPANNVTSAMLTIANRAPLADVGPDQNALTDETITLDGSASFDPDGHLPLTYEWQQIGGVPIMLSSDTVSRPLFTATAVPSILRFSLSVTDSFGLRSIAAATTAVTVTDRPVINLLAVNDSPTTLGHPTWFTATADGSNISYTWNFGDGATTIGQVATHTYSTSGIYIALVTATNSGGSVMATMPVTITNLAPFANAGPDQSIAVNTLVMLDGSASNDPDGHLPLSYEWQQISGSPVVLSSCVISRPIFTAPNSSSILAFSLNVTDSTGLRSLVSDTVVITVSDQPVSTLMAVSSSPTVLGQATWFTATAEGNNVSYTWNFGDGVTAPGNPISHTYAAQGFYTATITGVNGVNTLTATLPVTITNLAPVAVAGPNQDVIVNSQVDLDSSGSYDQDGHWPLAYQWMQVGGPMVLLSSAVVSRPTFTASATPSVLTFTLRVTDAYGLASVVDTTVIHVTDQVITGLQASNSSPIKVGQSVNLTATLVAGSNVTYQWNFGDGIISVPTNLLTAAHVYTRYGSFTAIVTATNQSSIEIGETPVVVQPYSIYIPLLRKDS